MNTTNQEVVVEEVKTLFGQSNVLKVNLTEENYINEINALLFRLKTDETLIRPVLSEENLTKYPQYDKDYPRAEATTHDGFILDFCQKDEVDHILARLEYNRKIYEGVEKAYLIDSSELQKLQETKEIDLRSDFNKLPVPNKAKKLDLDWIESKTHFNVINIYTKDKGSHITAEIEPENITFIDDIFKCIEELFTKQTSLDRVIIKVNKVRLNIPSGLSSEQMYKHFSEGKDAQDREFECNFQNGNIDEFLIKAIYDHYID